MMQTYRSGNAERRKTVRSKLTNRPESVAGVDGRSTQGRRRRDLIAGFVNALGGADKVSAATMNDVVRASDLVMLAERARADSLRGDDTRISVSDLIRLEGAADRAVRRLAIKPGADSAAPSLKQYLLETYGTGAAPEADSAEAE